MATAAEYTRKAIGSLDIRVGIICGSGLGGLQDVLEQDSKKEIAYKDLPGIPDSTVKGHEGKLVVGTINGLGVALLVGRQHFYEGNEMDLVTSSTKLLCNLGVKIIIVTNSAGGLNPDYKVGDIVVLKDHISFPSLSGPNPLRGINDDSHGPRFTPLSDAYDLPLRVKAFQHWNRLPEELRGARALHAGTYAYVSGPTYETRAESRAIRSLGGDVVGMSTVPEISVARHRGVRVLAMSLVTNEVVLAEGPNGNEEELASLSDQELSEIYTKGKANHEEVVAAGQQAAKTMVGLVRDLLKTFSTSE